MEEAEPKRQVVIWFPPELLEALDELAARERRSRTQQVLLIIEKAIAAVA